MPRMPAKAAGRRLTARGIAVFLAALAETGMVCDAAAQAGVPRASLYRKKAADADFAAAWAAALEAGLDRLRDEAVRRARDGVEETVWHRGVAVGTVRRYSDQLLMFLLRAHQPALYREKYVAPAGAGEADDPLGEILAQIDGKTRLIHATGEEPAGVSPEAWREMKRQLRDEVEARMRAEAADSAPASDAGAPDDGGAGPEDAAGNAAAAAPAPDRARPGGARPPAGMTAGAAVAFAHPGGTVGMDYDPLQPYPAEPP